MTLDVPRDEAGYEADVELVDAVDEVEAAAPASDDVVVLPRPSLARSATLTAIASLAPVAALLLWLTHDTGDWPAVLWVADVVIVIGLVAYWRYRVSSTVVSPTEFVKRGWLPGFVRLRRDRIAALVLVRTYLSHSTETVPQLYATDASGARLFRMRGTYWSEEAVARVVEALDVPTTRVAKPLTPREFHREHPAARYWYEGRPWLSGPVVVGLFAAATGGLVLLYGVLAG